MVGGGHLSSCYCWNCCFVLWKANVCSGARFLIWLVCVRTVRDNGEAISPGCGGAGQSDAYQSRLQVSCSWAVCVLRRTCGIHTTRTIACVDEGICVCVCVSLAHRPVYFVYVCLICGGGVWTLRLFARSWRWVMAVGSETLQSRQAQSVRDPPYTCSCQWAEPVAATASLALPTQLASQRSLRPPANSWLTQVAH